MKEDWKECKLGDVVEINQNSFSEKENWMFVNYLDTGSITENKISEIQYINLIDEKLPSRAKRKVKKNSIIYSTVRPNQKHFGIIKSFPENFLVSTGFAVLDVNKKIAFPDFVYYYLIQNENTESLHAIAEQTTSAYPAIKPSDIADISIILPPLATQQKIAQILSSLDDKIELNNKINDNLEQQVTTVFNNMFNKYEQNHTNYKPLSTIAKFKYGTMPKKDKLGTGQYHAFSGYQLVGAYPEVMFENPQLIIVARGVGGCGDVKYTPANCYLTNLSIAIITEKTVHDDYLYHYLHLHDTKVMNTGSAQPQITVATLEKFEIPIPPEEELVLFSDFVQPFKQQYRNNLAENKRLSELRDSLLSKLMSGELDVDEVKV